MNHTIKYWLFFSIGICLLLQSCNDDKSPVYEFTAAPELVRLITPALYSTKKLKISSLKHFHGVPGNTDFKLHLSTLSK